MTTQRSGKPSDQVTQARAAAQRAKLDAQAEAKRTRTAEQEATTPKKTKGKKDGSKSPIDIPAFLRRRILSPTRSNSGLSAVSIALSHWI